jgi:hypothetical protein
MIRAFCGEIWHFAGLASRMQIVHHLAAVPNPDEAEADAEPEGEPVSV